MTKENGVFLSPSPEEGKENTIKDHGSGEERRASPEDEKKYPSEIKEELTALENVEGEEPAGVTIESLQQRIAELEQEKEEMKNRLLRLQADFENFRRRARQEKEELITYANFELLKKLLPVVDNLERALMASQKGPEGIAEGVEMIKKHLLDILSKEGVTPIECVGKPFDPNFHDAVCKEESSDCPPGTVVEELQKGYLFKDKVLRASMVKVAAE